MVKHFLETPHPLYELKNEKYFAALRLKMEMNIYEINTEAQRRGGK